MNNVGNSIFKFLLFVFGYTLLIIIFFLNSDINPSIVSHIHETRIQVNQRGLLSGEIHSEFDNLSMLTLNFKKSTMLSVPSIFRLKEKNSNKWIHISEIDTSQYYVYPIYNFGFPTIVQSKNKKYYFELEISKQKGNGQNISINTKRNSVTTKYKFPVVQLLKNKNLLFEFIINKILFYIQTHSIIPIILSFLVSIYIYIYLYNHKKYLILFRQVAQISRPSYLLNRVLLMYALIDIMCVYKSKEIILLGAVLIRLACIYLYHSNPSDSFKKGLIFFLISGYFYLFDMIYIAERAAEYFYIFLVIGIMQKLIIYLTVRIKKINNKNDYS